MDNKELQLISLNYLTNIDINFTTTKPLMYFF